MANSTISLNNWKWKLDQKSAENCPFPASIYEWHDCKHKNTTTEIFTDLVAASYIPEPFNDLNEHNERIQWVKQGDWVYSAVFMKQERELHEDSKNERSLDLVLEGLDTFATVKVNGTVVLESDNMFHRHRISIWKQADRIVNTVEITFRSAWKKGLELESKAGMGKLKACNGHSSRTQVRKAAYHYGWDWGPALMTCGPWREVRVESYLARFCNPYARFEFGDDPASGEGLKILDHATLIVRWESIESLLPIRPEDDFCLRVTVLDPEKNIVGRAVRSVPSAAVPQQAKFDIQEPRLWWPRGLGKQALYEVRLEVVPPGEDSGNGGDVILYVGARTAQLHRKPLQDEQGETFCFMINNQLLYISGSNMIPLHMFPTQVMPEDYQTAVKNCLEGNQNMIRVWGGGIYEHDDFYSQCDDQGLLVWQDFMFACAQYPWQHDFQENVKKEARDQLCRLRNYCSIVIYTGNNEDHQVIEAFGLQKSFWARELYEKVLPEIISDLIPDMAYWPGSPWSGNDSTDPFVGDIHQWDVWHGTQEPYQLWSKLTGRFVSEFGMLSYPSSVCINDFITNPGQRYPQSAAMEDHMKSEGGVRRLALYILENLRMDSTKMHDWIYASQLIQAECLTYAIRSCRRRWQGPGKYYCGGQIVWQLNDVYPAASWSLVDFYGERKLAWYAVKRESAPVTIGIERTTPEMAKLKCGLRNRDQDTPGNTTLSLRGSSYQSAVWISTTAPVPEGPVRLQLRLYDVRTGDCVQKYDETQHELSINTCLDIRAGINVGDQILLVATLLHGQRIIARAFDWPQPLKYVQFHPTIRVSITRVGESVTVRSPQAVKGLELYVVGRETDDSIKWSDNGFDLAPREAYEVKGEGLFEDMEVKVQFYGSG